MAYCCRKENCGYLFFDYSETVMNTVQAAVSCRRVDLVPLRFVEVRKFKIKMSRNILAS